MEIEQLRQKLHQYIDSLDAVSLDEVYNILGEEDIAWKYSQDDIEMFYKRRNFYQNGEGRSYTIEEMRSPKNNVLSTYNKT